MSEQADKRALLVTKTNAKNSCTTLWGNAMKLVPQVQMHLGLTQLIVTATTAAETKAQ